jgi:hypothetical protein
MFPCSNVNSPNVASHTLALLVTPTNKFFVLVTITQLFLVKADGGATGIMELRSDYRVLENNCQHFAKALVRDITGKDFGPKMIAEVLKPYIDIVDNATSIVRMRTHSVQLSPPHERTRFSFSGTTRTLPAGFLVLVGVC